MEEREEQEAEVNDPTFALRVAQAQAQAAEEVLDVTMGSPKEEDVAALEVVEDATDT